MNTTIVWNININNVRDEIVSNCPGVVVLDNWRRYNQICIPMTIKKPTNMDLAARMFANVVVPLMVPFWVYEIPQSGE